MVWCARTAAATRRQLSACPKWWQRRPYPQCSLQPVLALAPVFGEAAGARVPNHGDGKCLPRRRIDWTAALDERLLDAGEDAPDVGFHRDPSSPLMSLAARPPARAWTRGPVVIASTTSISEA